MKIPADLDPTHPLKNAGPGAPLEEFLGPPVYIIIGYREDGLSFRHRVKGNMHTISPGRNRVNFQILAYLLTIDLLYGTGCLSYWFCYYMLRLDSSEMLPGSQKGEETAQILKTHTTFRHCGSPKFLQLVMITWTGNETGNDHVTRADARRCHVPMWKRWNTTSYISGSRMVISIRSTVNGIPVLIILP